MLKALTIVYSCEYKRRKAETTVGSFSAPSQTAKCSFLDHSYLDPKKSKRMSKKGALLTVGRRRRRKEQRLERAYHGVM